MIDFCYEVDAREAVVVEHVTDHEEEKLVAVSAELFVLELIECSMLSNVAVVLGSEVDLHEAVENYSSRLVDRVILNPLLLLLLERLLHLSLVSSEGLHFEHQVNNPLDGILKIGLPIAHVRA